MAVTYSVCEACKQVNKVNLGEATHQSPICGKCRAPLPLRGDVNHLSYAALVALAKKSPIPVIADFWAERCAPCRSFGPVFEKTARELLGRFVFVKLDMDRNPAAGQALGIKSIPTLILFSRGAEIKREVGAMTEALFKAWLTK